jgi:hypothetical protein
VIKTSDLQRAKESSVYCPLVWGLILVGCAILQASPNRWCCW